MSANTWASSPRFGPLFADGLVDGGSSLDLAFDGADDLLRAWREGLTPDPALTVSAWADRHRILSPRGSSEAGPWRTSRTPYLRELMDALSPRHPAQRVAFMKASQLGATESGCCWIGYVIDHAPGPMLAVQPTVELAKRFSQQRIDPLIEESPALREKVAPARSRDAGNTVLSKEFPGGILVLTGANSAVGLRSMPVRYLFLDEVDAYPPSADDEGDPVALAEARTRTFSWRRKVFLASTPTIRGLSRIEREYQASDQRRYFVPCPHCGHRQFLVFERLRWDKGRPETAAYVCEACERPIGEHHKTTMLAEGEWRPTAASADPLSIGFHLSSLYSPVGWLSWERIAREWEAAQGSDEAKRSFVNTVLGETWAETGEAPDWQRLYERREGWRRGTVPALGLILTAGADVQKDRIEVSIWAWGRELESWLVDHLVVEAGPGSTGAWAQLERAFAPALAARERRRGSARPPRHRHRLRGAGGLCLGPRQPAGQLRQGRGELQPLLAGQRADLRRRDDRRAEAQARRQAVDRRGLDLQERALSVLAPLAADRRGDHRRQRLSRCGYVHLPAGVESEWLKQLVSEQLVTITNRRGFQRLEWQKLRERNEALDCRVYARAAAWIAGIDRMSAAQWSRLETMVAPPAPPPPLEHRERLERVSAPRRRANPRLIPSAWMSD